MGEGVLYMPRSGCLYPVWRGTGFPCDLCRCISHFSDLPLRHLNEDSLAFTLSIFPLPGYISWLDASLGVTLRFTPCRCQQRMGVLETVLDTGLESC